MPEAIIPRQDWETYLDHLMKCFREALRSLDLSSAFLSLTAGLDTRTILAALLADGRQLPACTMSWKNRSLDARVARTLCRVYDIPHQTVDFDEHLHADYPSLLLTASRLSGGLCATDQATEVAFYQRLLGPWSTRLSGYLGNQVGRGGVEQVSPRGGDLSMLGEELVAPKSLTDASGRLDRSGDQTAPRCMSPLNEALFASVGNYSIGHYFMVQQSPYASRGLIEMLALGPRPDAPPSSPSRLRMRLHDLRHRFLGEPIGRSFQRRLIREVGGFVASCPINWGWRATGRVSLPGTAQGLLAFSDAFAASRGLDCGMAGYVLDILNITGRHDFRQLRKWYSREFLYDTLRRQSLREQGVFNQKRIELVLNEHFAGRVDHHADLMLALDLSSAQQVFLDQSSHSPFVGVTGRS